MSNYEKVTQITEELDQKVQELFTSEKYEYWLNTMSQFHRYSLNNVILICSQKPDATYVAGYSTWKNKFNRQVRKGEKGIHILAPVPFQFKIVQDDGETEITKYSFRVVCVFDISQTHGDPLPSINKDLTEAVDHYENFLNVILKLCDIPVTFEDLEPGVKGYFDKTENVIAIQRGMTETQTIKTLLHEIAHQRLHSTDSESVDLNTKEVQAESVAYTVCKHFGIDTSSYSFGYIAAWSKGRQTEELKSSLSEIRNCAFHMIEEIEKNLEVE